MTENIETQEASRSKKKKGALAAGGLLGIGALATTAILSTGANWTDSEAAGSELGTGNFTLEIATTAVGETPGEDDWSVGTTVDAFEDIATISALNGDGWGPGDYAEGEIHVQLVAGTSHDAQLTTDVENRADGFTITGPEGIDEVLNTGETATFEVSVLANAGDASDSLEQDTNGSIVWTFEAESIPNAPNT